MHISVPVEIDEKMFLSFAHFETYRRQKRWKGPLLFGAILIASALICLLGPARRGSVLLGCVLIGVAVLLPAGYFLSYELSLKKQSRAMKLNKPVKAYTVNMDENHVHVTYAEKSGKTENYRWEKLYGAFEKPDVIYLYITRARALILPLDKAEPDREGLIALIRGKVQNYKKL